jgi:hypothetical protein
MSNNGEFFCMLLDVMNDVADNPMLATAEERGLLDGLGDRQELSGFTLSERRLITDLHDRTTRQRGYRLFDCVL